MSFRSRYKNRIRELGGMAVAKKFVESWYNNNLNTDIKNNLSISGSIQKSGKFLPGNIYSFKYNPIHRDKLAYYDRNPVMISLGKKPIKGGYLEMGLNLNFLPDQPKITTLNIIEEAYAKTIKSEIRKGKAASKQRQLLIDYNIMKEMLPKQLRFSIRTYSPSRIVSLKVISFDSWVYVPLLDVKKITGASIQEIYKSYHTGEKIDNK